MKIFYDTEFLEDGETIKLISIGMVREDGKHLYLINSNLLVLREAYKDKWMRNNVLKYLPVVIFPGDDTEDHNELNWNTADPEFKKVFFPHGQFGIAAQVKKFISDTPDPELWAWYGAYDHVCYAQLFGKMINLPLGFPMWTNDVKQEHVRLGSPRLPEQVSGAHNALADAQWTKSAYEYLQSLRTAPVANPERVRR